MVIWSALIAFVRIKALMPLKDEACHKPNPKADEQITLEAVPHRLAVRPRRPTISKRPFLCTPMTLRWSICNGSETKPKLGWYNFFLQQLRAFTAKPPGNVPKPAALP
jgi:hypothetical protein